MKNNILTTKELVNSTKVFRPYVDAVLSTTRRAQQFTNSFVVEISSLKIV
jgi:hypothetical protein